MTYDDAALTDIQNKMEKLRDASSIDINTRLDLWRDTVHLRRKTIRDRSTAQILEEFPGYSEPVLVRLFDTCCFDV